MRFRWLVVGVAIVCGVPVGLRADELPVIPLTPGASPHGSAGPASASPGQPSPTPGAPSEDTVVARVNGIELHRSDLEAARRGLPPEAQKLPFEQVYPVLLDRMINGELLIDAGRKAHLENDPEVKRRLVRYEDRLIQEAYIDRLVTDAATEERLRARYQAFLRERPAQEQVHARHILVPTEAEAKTVIAELDKGADFAALAKKYSKDPGTDSGGDLGYFTKDEMVPAFAQAAFALPVGGYTKTPVKTEFGWHVIKVEDRRMAQPPSFEEAHDELVNQVANEVLAERVKQLRAEAKIEAFGPDGKPLAAIR
ncbi:MAG: peptidylprolyl isomerase [Alphaproteobacteria bacterium]|nr:peptidylprolyl isomerase [Alphaproteobacteria bacterium]